MAATSVRTRNAPAHCIPEGHLREGRFINQINSARPNSTWLAAIDEKQTTMEAASAIAADCCCAIVTAFIVVLKSKEVAMELYLLRHGIAEDLAPGGRDADRALTAEGKRKLKEVLKVASAQLRPTLILSSPYRRAKETAVVAAQALRYEKEILESSQIVPHGRPEDLWQEVRSHRNEPKLLVVSHEPLLGQAMGWLLNAPSLEVDVKKGSLMRIDLESFGARPRGRLKFFLTPRLVV
jgi:phosphohistidine phosphatase